MIVYVPAFRLFGGKYSLSRDIADLTLEKYQIVDAGRISDIEICDISVTSFIIKVKFKIDNADYVVWVYELGKQAYWHTTKEVLDSYREEMNELAEYMKNFTMRD